MPRGVYVRTEEHNKRNSEAQKGKKHSEETKRKMSVAGKIHNKRDKNPMFGKHHSKETRQKMSDKKKGKNHPNYGKHLSVETRKKLSEAKKGKFGNKHSSWKGDDVSLDQLHNRVRNVKPKPPVCDICHQKTDKNGSSKLELSNIRDHNYTDNPDDYQYAHNNCHRIYDNENKIKEE